MIDNNNQELFSICVTLHKKATWPKEERKKEKDKFQKSLFLILGIMHVFF